MFKKLALVSLVCITFTAYAKQPQRSVPGKPLTQQQLLALVAGQSLPENIVAEIRILGLGFAPDSAYLGLLKTASALPKVFAAISAAHKEPSTAGISGNSVSLQHLSRAGEALSSNQLDVAITELNQALSAGADRPSAGFVMGMVLMRQNQWQAAHEVYSELLHEDADFPQLHTRLSATSYHLNDYDQMLRESKAALRQIPTDSAAHLNAGLALMNLGKIDAAKLELQASIENKPDYEAAYAGLAHVLDKANDYDGAIAQYKKALALQPSDDRSRYSLGVSYMHKNDFLAAITEFRIVKTHDPQNLEARQNLGACLLHVDPPAAIAEFKELVEISPSFQVCHVCLASALSQTGRFVEAQREYALAIELDPTEAKTYVGMGLTLEAQNKYDDALRAYRKAQELDPREADAFTKAGRALLMKKDFSSAIVELRHAAQIAPADWNIPDLEGQALEASGNLKTAITEYSEAVSLAPKETQPHLDLAQAQEKEGDWTAALENYRLAATNEPPLKVGTTQVNYDAKAKYKSAQTRFQQHLADLRASGKSSQASDLQSQVAAIKTNSGSADKFQTLMQDGITAMTDKRFTEAEASFKQAQTIAEKIKPLDGRLPEVVGQLGNLYAWRADYQDAEAAYKRQLALDQTLYGSDNPMIVTPLQSLGMLYVAQKRFSDAEGVFTRSFVIDAKIYGENSTAAAGSLNNIAHVYLAQHDFPKAEVASLHVVKISESMYGENDYRVAPSVAVLCSIYDREKDPAKSESCHARMVLLEEKQFGATSPYLANDLNIEAQMLRQLGRSTEAASIESRIQSLQQSPQQ
jgi:tetratricopeptide (TPR) repeat protein